MVRHITVIIFFLPFAIGVGTFPRINPPLCTKIVFGNATLSVSAFILKPGAGTEGEGAEFPLDLTSADVFIRRKCFLITKVPRS